MDLSDYIKKNIFSRDFIINLCLVLFIFFGFVSKFIISMYFELDSDSVGMGLMSMEIGKHNNFFLSGYHLLSSDSLVFTELPFQLIPQILTNYNPVTLKIITFVIFVLSVAILGYLVYFVSRKIFPALLFGALAANIPADGYYWLAFPTSHNATILFGAAILLLVLYLNRLEENHTREVEKNRKKKTDDSYNVPLKHLILLMLLIFLVVLSDTIILVWLLIPYILAYLLFYPRKTKTTNLIVIIISIVSVTAYIIKTYFISDWFKVSYGINTLQDIFLVNLPLFFKAQVVFLNHGLSSLMGSVNAIGPIDIISIFLFVCTVIIMAKNFGFEWKNSSPAKKFFYSILLISMIMVFGSFLISTYAYDISGARYLSFSALILILLGSISYSERKNLPVFIILFLLVFSAISSFVYISTMGLNPNDREYNLINYLKGQNLTFGYGTYWDSNIITYLSGEQVTIRATYLLSG